MKTALPVKIKTEKEAIDFLLELQKNGEAFHPEDSALTVSWNLPENQKPTSAECYKLDQLMTEMYKLKNFDPCEVLLNG